jgi:hypothetical protein
MLLVYKAIHFQISNEMRQKYCYRVLSKSGCWLILCSMDIACVLRCELPAMLEDVLVFKNIKKFNRVFLSGASCF